MIRPSNGRIVLFTPAGYFPGQKHDTAQPLAAIVTHVWSDRMVNLTVFDSNGTPHAVTSVQLLQDEDAPNSGHYAEWMPYQKGQAAKTEALERAVVADKGRPVPHHGSGP